MDAARRERRHHRKAAAAAASVATGGVGGGVAARAAYGDVFGGPPRFAAPFGGAPVDYAEVFGGVAATCSIPYLDLPPAPAALGGDGGFFSACAGKTGDYGEIFARFDFADFALPYEDLFGEPEPLPGPERDEIASSSGSSRSSIKNEFGQLEDEFPILSQHHQNLDHRQHFEEPKFSSISFSSDTNSQHIVKSDNKIAERSSDGLVEMTSCTVEPSMDFVVDSHNSLLRPATNHVSRFDNGIMANGKNEKNPSSATVNLRSHNSDFIVDQKQASPSQPPISGGVPANENHKNSDSHSTHRRGTPHDYTFLQVSDVDAQTQPVKVQAQSKQQPNLLNEKESAAKEAINFVNQSFTTTSSARSTSSSNVPQADKKADANPTSASAAMKEAMDFAEARLKAAKELLERKGDSFKLRKKPSHHRSTRSTEIKVPVHVEVDTSEPISSVKKPSKEEKNADDSFSDKHKKKSAVRLDHFDANEKRVLPVGKPQQMMQHCTESCQTSSKLAELGNWRSGDEFYELNGDDQKHKTDVATGEGDKCARTDPIACAINDKESETDIRTVDSDLEKYEKLWEVNDGRDVGVKQVNLTENNKTSVDKDGVPVIFEASTENMAHQEIHNPNIEELVTLENAKESLDDDECVELPSMNDTSTKLDFIKDMSGSLPEAFPSGNHANDLSDLGNSSPKVNPVAGTSQEHTDSNLLFGAPCDGGIQCTSESTENLQESSEVSNVNVSQGSNIKQLILEELEESYVCDAFPRGLSRVEQEAETYGREKFSFIEESLLHTKGVEINEVLSVEVDKGEIEEKVGPCTHPEETVMDLGAECSEGKNDRQNADHEESTMLNVFEVASKLIKRDLDQESRGSLGHGQVDNVEKKTDGLIYYSNAKDTDVENIERTGTEEGSVCCNQDDQKSSEIIRGQSDVDAKSNTTGDEIGSESLSGDEVIIIKAAGDSTTRMTINSKDELASSSEMHTRMQHSTQKDVSANFEASNMIFLGLEETGEVCNGGERELPTEKSTCEEMKSSENRMQEKETSAKISKAEHEPSPLEKNHSPLKYADGPTPVSADTLVKEELGVQRAKEGRSITRAESASEKDKGSSRRTEETKESERRLKKERELAKEKERKKLEEEERERERKKDRLAVERATREAHERAFAEAREKAEKMALERITAARQRASAEAREREERASADVAAERATREARIKAERAAVERATAEARERAIEKAKAEKALAEARERRERYRSSFKESFKSTNQDIQQESQFQRTSSNFNRNPDSGNKVVEVESALRHKARIERHQRTAERVTKALAEKNMRDLLAQREQTEKHRMSEFLDPEVKRWSNGKEGNLRALLSTLQYILSADSGWQPVPLTDLITAAGVKKAYRKATLCVHPDKLQQRGATIRQRYICEKVFDLLKDAWNKFTSEER